MRAKLTTLSARNFEPADQAYEIVDTELKGFLMRVQPTGLKTFYYSYRNSDGRRKRIKIGPLGPSLTLAQARDKATSMAGKVADGTDVQADKVEGRQRAKETLKGTLGRFLEEQYQPWALANHKSGQNTINIVKASFPDLLTLPMSQIQLKRMERWRTEKMQQDRKATYVNRCVNALRGVITKAVEWEVLEEHPLKRLKNLKVDEGRKARYLSSDEEFRMLAALKERDDELKKARTRGNEHRAERGYPLLPDISHLAYADRMTPMVTLSLKTGMRRGEQFDLMWSEVDLINNVITVNGATAKSSKTRHIPLSPSAREVLGKWRGQCGLNEARVFPADDGGRLDNVKSSWTTILKKAGITQFRWHDMRHDFASKLVMRGVPLNTVRELCGHASLNTTLRYAHLAPDHKADAVALIG
ncbi:tyrosine-type recombinase/integrase [Gilvimarinus japonicus]|uniref:Tyrosine-type recombinase/integrase n=1 Tax=Gilvimarinus japonicus TaxID=1796469 RepID=A0ABV7HRJ6_9GAMM